MIPNLCINKFNSKDKKRQMTKMGKTSDFVFILIIMVAIGYTESTTHKTTNGTSFNPSEILEEKIEGCKEGKWGCLGFPDGCNQADTCQMLATYHVNNSGDATFSLMGPSDMTEYLAIGLSIDENMGNDYVVSCHNDGERFAIDFTWNDNWKDGSWNDNWKLEEPANVDGRKGVFVLEHKLSDHWRYCKFTLLNGTFFVSQRSNSDRIGPLRLDQPYHLQLAKGERNNGKLQYHGSNKIVSESALYLNSKKSQNGEDTNSDILVKVHGAMMVISWMFFADIGTFTAGYTRTKYPEHSGLYWFHIHRACMSIACILTMVSALMMFIGKGLAPLNIVKISSNPHTLIGLITLILTCIQPIMGFFRPDPLSSRRRYFNVIHRYNGYLTSCIAFVAILSASLLQEAKLQSAYGDYLIYVSGSFVGFFFLCHLFLRLVELRGLTEMVSMGYFTCIAGLFSFMITFLFILVVL